MVDFSSIPVIDVQMDNVEEMWPVILQAIKESSFTAIDFELSGLGNKKMLNAKQMEDRYKAISDAASTRSIISMGLSCFKLQSIAPKGTPHTQSGCGMNSSFSAESPDTVSACSRVGKMTYEVQTYNISLLCQQDYVIEPGAVKFLVEHGFDFNKQYSMGIPFYHGPDLSATDRKVGVHRETHAIAITYMRDLFSTLVLSEVPLVLHNALVDLVFMYNSFYAPLPTTVASFCADLEELFPAGIYDTKYICEYKSRYIASFLEYVFRKNQRANVNASTISNSTVELNFPELAEDSLNLTIIKCTLPTELSSKDIDVCENYAGYGWCAFGRKCKQSHNIDHILDLVEEKANARRKRKKRQKREEKLSESADKPVDNTDKCANGETSEECEKKVKIYPNALMQEAEGHRAGYDAFMTAFCFSYDLLRYSRLNKECVVDELTYKSFGMHKEFANNIYLSGKDIPLQLCKSEFTKTSKQHREKYKLLKEKIVEKNSTRENSIGEKLTPELPTTEQ